MYVQGTIARLDGDEESVSVVPEHWRVSPDDPSVVVHIPTGNLCQVSIGDEVSEGMKAGIYNMQARLCWMPEGSIVPDAQSEMEFGQAAIAVWMVENGLWVPEVRDSPRTPGQSAMKDLARGFVRQERVRRSPVA